MQFATQEENKLFNYSQNPRPTSPTLPFTLVFPATEQVATPKRKFLIYSPQEGVSSVLTVAYNMGWDVEVIDLRYGNISLEQAVAHCAKRGGVVAMPTFADSYTQNEFILAGVKRLNPSIVTLLGGSLISSLPEVVMATLEADYGVLREGELTLMELLECIDGGGGKEAAKNIPGLAIRFATDHIFYSSPRKQIRSLDVLPFPRLDLYPTVRNDAFIPEMGITTSRGCYGRCSFCFLNMKALMYKSLNYVDEELRFLRDRHGVKYFYINDLTFTADQQRAAQIASLFCKYGIEWSCSTRVESIKPELLRHMKKSGCREIWYGVESVDQTVLDLCNKKQTVQQIIEAIRETQNAGITVMSNLIVGLPGESRDSLKKMLDFVRNGDVIPASIKYLTPFPGTRIYDLAVEKGLITDSVSYLKSLCRRKVNCVEDEIINLTDLPEREIRDAFAAIMQIRDSRIKEQNVC